MGTLQQLGREHGHEAPRVGADDLEDASEVVKLVGVQEDVHAAVLVHDELEEAAQGTGTCLVVAEEGIVLALGPRRTETAMQAEESAAKGKTQSTQASSTATRKLVSVWFRRSSGDARSNRISRAVERTRSL